MSDEEFASRTQAFQEATKASNQKARGRWSWQ